MGKFIDLTDKRFGKLVVIRRVTDDKHKNRRWLCRCDCDKEKTVHGSSLASGLTKSCGCLQKSIVSKLFTQHGYTVRKPKLYKMWSAMKQRCVNPKHKSYHTYGGRGISVCEQWRNSFPKFLEDMGNPPTKKHQIERVDNEDGYCKANCVWATPKQQARNRCTNHLLTHDGKTQTLTDWAIETGLERRTIGARLKRGWLIKNALTTQIKKRDKS